MTALRNIPLVVAPHAFPVYAAIAPVPVQEPLRPCLLPTEREFYGAYEWALNPYPTVASVGKYLGEELKRLEQTDEGWQLQERMTNIFMLASAIANEVDDHLIGRRYDLSKLARVPLGGIAVRTTNKAQSYGRRVREWRLRHLSAWNDRWLTGLDEFLRLFVAEEPVRPDDLRKAKQGLETLLGIKWDAELAARRLRNPAFFHVRDLTHVDVLKLGEKFVAAYADRAEAIVLIGLRTAGSYFGPLLRAFLRNKGYERVELISLRPRTAMSWREKGQVAAAAKAGKMAVLLDEPPCSGGSTAEIAKMLAKAGFAKSKIVGLFPVHYLFRDWKKGWGKLLDSGMRTLTVEPGEWHKEGLLQPAAAEAVLREYFLGRGYISAKVVEGENAERFNAQVRYCSDEKMHTRLKRVYEVQLKNERGEPETRYVFAKSVGWGWLAYRAFLAGERLQKFVPPILGLRNGMLYSEWVPRDVHGDSAATQTDWVETIASYVATRVRLLKMEDDPAQDLVRENLHKGYEELADLLGRAYGSSPASAFKRPRIQHELTRQRYPAPTLVDGKMWRREWIETGTSPLKTDFEHHAMGKRKLEMTDPAYDLAEGILHFKLKEEEERRLIRRYIEETGDSTVAQRLFMNKLLAGAWAMVNVRLNLKDPHLRHRYQEFNQQYIEAWEFLTTQTVRRCGQLCERPQEPRWSAPLMALDVDGVLDRNIFYSFPCTSAAGIRALSTFHAHGIGVSLNSARSLEEVKEYCRVYGLVGGVAEYGSAFWDAVKQKEQVLTNAEARAQLKQLASVLRRLPGIFINDSYQHSIRAYTFERERTSPLPTMQIADVMGSLKLDRLRFHQTDLDTAILAKDVNKGTGLAALLEHAGVRYEDCAAVGDSEPDLDMFRVAGRAYAPSQIWCRDKAVSLGCQIASRPYQLGLLEIARGMAHADGKRCGRCAQGERSWRKSDDLFMQLLEVADHKKIPLLIRSILDPMAIRTFVK